MKKYYSFFFSLSDRFLHTVYVASVRGPDIKFHRHELW